MQVHYLGPFDHQCPSCCAFHWIAERKSSLTLSAPSFSSCCKAGDVLLPFLQDLPPALQLLYDGCHREAVEFRQHIHSYNKALAFTYTGGRNHLVASSYNGRGPPHYKIHGEIFHRLGPIEPEEGVDPVFSQLYIYDHNEALHYRQHANPERSVDTLNCLQSLLERCHPLVDVYVQASRLSRETSLTNYRLQLNFRKGMDRRRYNLPTGDHELAMIIPGDENVVANAQQILLRPRGGPLVQISQCDPSFLTLHFPLLMPTGQFGWEPNIPFVSSTPDSTRHVSLSDYAKFHLHPRPPHVESDHVFKAAQLFQEYIIHLWAAAEHSRLMWI